MKLFLIKWFCRFLLRISPILWKMRGKWSFVLHQKVGLIAIRLIHKYKLPVWNEIDFK